FLYVDDDHGAERPLNLRIYQPYARVFPAGQALTLELWDEVRTPHEEKKQINGSVLTIIGFLVDAINMSATLPDEKRKILIQTIEAFAHVGLRPTVRECQQLTGHVNWSLNVFPLIRPCLCALYDKLVGKNQPNATVWTNKAIVDDLLWGLTHLRSLPGVFFFDSVQWD
ncbi:hypothetical protein CONPUDRAFT_34380, partial [Coniophora puteana RWD-64-598 SS2]